MYFWEGCSNIHIHHNIILDCDRGIGLGLPVSPSTTAPQLQHVNSAHVHDNFIAGVNGPPAHVNCRCFTTVVIPDGWDTPDRVWNGS